MLEELFENKEMARVIEHFILHEKFEQNRKDLCEINEIYPTEMKLILKKLIDWGIIVKTREIAMTGFYLVNPKSELITPLRILSQKFGIARALHIASEQK